MTTVKNPLEALHTATPDPRTAGIGFSAVAHICEAIGYSDLVQTDRYQQRIAGDISTLIRHTYPAGIEQRHPKDIHLITENSKRYDALTERHIKQDEPVRTINRLAKQFRDADREIPDDLLRAYKIRRTIVACMLHYSGHNVTEVVKDIRISRLQ